MDLDQGRGLLRGQDRSLQRLERLLGILPRTSPLEIIQRLVEPEEPQRLGERKPRRFNGDRHSGLLLGR